MIQSVHPHTHGEHHSLQTACGFCIGSSPHAWGTRIYILHRAACLRFIPTRMGNTPYPEPTTVDPTVHPHTHGEHPKGVGATRYVSGSSPHAWGTRGLSGKPFIVYRFIPTRMGNTLQARVHSRARAVHPHTHGEHSICQGKGYNDNGSSPHAWGTHRSQDGPPGFLRFIPTRMGNTTKTAAVIDALAVHPHTHGEHYFTTNSYITLIGSSPHAWGTLSVKCIQANMTRFIPTRMGNTPNSYNDVVSGTVHPHTHGEHKKLSG